MKCCVVRGVNRMERNSTLPVRADRNALGSRLVRIHQMTLGGALALVTFIVMSVVFMHEFEAMINGGRVHARMLADHATASLIFNDHGTAEEVLNSLHHVEGIQVAGLYARDRVLFARYGDQQQKLRGTLVSLEARDFIDFDCIRLVQPIVFQGQVQGAAVLEINLTSFYEKLGWLALLILATGTSALVVTRRLIHRQSMAVLRPLSGLAGVMQQVSEKIDYGVRATSSGITELDQLSTGFNDMLARIQSQDEALRHYQNSLESQVQGRTAELQQAKERAEQASTKLAQSLSLMKATQDATDNGILVVNRQGQVSSVNRRFAEMWSIPDELLSSGDDQKILGHVLGQLADPEQFLQKVESLYAQPEVVSRDVIEFADGRIFARFSHPQSLAGEIVGRVWSFLDITEQQRAEQRVLHLSRVITEELERSEQQREQLQALLSAIPDLVWMKDGDGVFLSCNPAFGKLLGAPAHRVLGRTDFDFFPQEVAESFRADDRTAIASNGPIVREEWVTYADDGRRALLETVKTAVRNQEGKLYGVLGIARDVTRMRTLLEELERARQEAQQSNDAKSMFLASMSHELRTPLNAIIGFAQILDMGVPAPLDPSHQEAVGHILGSGRHLLGLINEVLDLVRIESGKLDLALSNMILEVPLREAMALVQASATNRGISLRHSCPSRIQVYADPSRVRQILLNLLSNAIKYNRMNGMVVVSCQDKSGMTRITVSDTGPGIPEERHSLLFQPFQRLGAERTATEGSGIGLVISKKLVEAMQGCIGFDSEEGVGSRFWIELPSAGNLERIGLAEDPVPVLVTDQILRGRVLYVEDNPVNLSVMQYVFRMLPGVELLTRESAEEGLELIQDTPPDLVLMDINLPGMSGVEALRIIKADPRTAHLPVVAVSAAALPVDIRKGLDAGFMGYLTKPFDVPELIKLVREVLTAK